MTKTKSNLAAIAAAVLLTVVTFQQTVMVPAESSAAPIATAHLA